MTMNVRESLEGLLKSPGHTVAVFSSAESFLSSTAREFPMQSA